MTNINKNKFDAKNKWNLLKPSESSPAIAQKEKSEKKKKMWIEKKTKKMKKKHV